MPSYNRLKYHGDGDMILHHKRGIYSVASKREMKLDQILENHAYDAIRYNKNSGKKLQVEILYSNYTSFTKSMKAMAQLN